MSLGAIYKTRENYTAIKHTDGKKKQGNSYLSGNLNIVDCECNGISENVLIRVPCPRFI